MNDKDKEAFEIWWKETMPNPDWLSSDHASDVCKAWQAACEYKQSQVNEIELKEIKINRAFVELAAKFVKLQEELLLAREAASSEAALVNELQAENAKLKEHLLIATNLIRATRPNDGLKK